MMITPWTVYWITILDSLSCGLFIFGVMGIAIGFGGYSLSENYRTDKPKNPKFFRFVYFGIFLLVVDMFLPATKDMAAILVIPKIANNQKVQAIPSKILDLATEWLDALKPKETK